MNSDEELFRRTREGDMSAFDGLYARYEGPLFGFLLGVLGSREDAEETFHEAFMSVLKSPEPRFAAGGFRAWLYRVARNAALNRMRSERRGTRALSRMPDQEAAASPDRELAEHQRNAALEGAVERLPPALSDVYRLRTSGL